MTIDKSQGRAIASSRHRQRGSVLSEYVVVVAGLLIVFTSLNVILRLIREHGDEFSSALQLPL